MHIMIQSTVIGLGRTVPMWTCKIPEYSTANSNNDDVSLVTSAIASMRSLKSLSTGQEFQGLLLSVTGQLNDPLPIGWKQLQGLLQVSLDISTNLNINWFEAKTPRGHFNWQKNKQFNYFYRIYTPLSSTIGANYSVCLPEDLQLWNVWTLCSVIATETQIFMKQYCNFIYALNVEHCLKKSLVNFFLITWYMKK